MNLHSKTCRLCLLDNAVVKISFEDENCSVVEMIKRCCQFEIMEDENLPQKLCLKCLNTLKICYEFILQCTENNNMLRQNIKKEIEKNSEIMTIEQKYFIKSEPVDEVEVKVYDVGIELEYENKSEHADAVDEQADEAVVDLSSQKNTKRKIAPGEIECEECGKIVKRCRFKGHKETHSTERKYVCDVCPKTFKVRESLRKHVKSVHMDNNVICDYCKKVCRNRISLKKHIFYMHLVEKNQACEICNRKFKLARQLKSHMRRHAKKKASDEMLCNEDGTGANINTKRKYSRSRIANDRIMCDICGKSVRRVQMRYHKETHSTERKYSCHLCPKKFKVHDLVRKHIKSMHTDTNVICEYCKKVYCSRESLMIHIANLHMPVNYHTCEVCNRKFKQARTLQIHMMVHTQEKPYQCRFCDSTFALRGTKKDHERLHMGITPYECPLCQKAFTQLCNLKSHFKYNHKESVFKDVYQSRKRGEIPAMDNSIAVPKIAVIRSRGRKTVNNDNNMDSWYIQ